MKLISAGAAQTVTGSCHLIEMGGKKLLLDCGLFQGPKEVDALNREPFPFELGEVDAVLMSHGHLDHVGRLPLLAQHGYDGPIYSTPPTRKIAEVILEDSAHIQREDYERALRRARRAGREDEVEPPLYEERDARRVLELFRPLPYEEKLDLGGVTARYSSAGHILGSAFIELECSDGRVIFSGDLGNRESSLQADAELPPECDAVLVETTYGNRNHPSTEETLKRFRRTIVRALETGGKVLIPSFALERTQVVLHQLKRLEEEGVLDDVPVFLDSPMATTFTEFYASCKNDFLPKIQQALERGDNPFEPSSMEYTVSADASRELNDLEGPAIIVAGSGMMTGGRILHHLKHHIWKEETSLLVVGYQAQGTLGRALVEGDKRVRIYGDEIAVRGDIETLNGFSAHADQDDLLAWLEPTGGADIYMVHGEPEVMTEFERTLAQRDRNAVMVVRGKPYKL